MTPPAPTRDTPAGQAYNDLRNLARREGRDPAEYITLYALEGFLARLAVSEHAGEFVLKGGVLMAAFAARRPTRDIDLAATGFTNDIPEVEQRVRSILAVPLDDGLQFDAASVSGEPIRDETDYNGVRVKVTARFDSRAIRITWCSQKRSSLRSNVVIRTPAGVTSPTLQPSPGLGVSAGRTFVRRSALLPVTARLTSNPSDR